jgi:hypothetical protein
MVARVIEVDPFDLIVFGATGDLAHRKLLPALYHRDLDGQIPEDARIIACSRRDMTDEDYRSFADEAVREHVDDIEAPALARFLARLSYIAVDAAGERGWSELANTLRGREDVVRAFYLAVSPDFFGTICERIGTYGLTTDLARVVIEKPIGKDGASARALNANDRRGVSRGPDLPHRSLSRQGNGAEPDGAAFRQCPVRAAVECGPYRPCADHGCRIARRRGRAGYYDTAGACATWCRTTFSSSCAWWRWSRRNP